MKKILLFAAATLALAACNNDDEYVDNGPVAVQVTATIGENAMTRASNTSWAVGDKIGITTLRKDESKYINMKYTTTAGDGVFTGNTMYFQDKTEPVTFTAYYPFTGSEGTAPGIIEAHTSAEYQTADRQPEIDFLHDRRASITGSDPKVNFMFSHRMSKLTLTFKNGTGADVGKITSYSIDGLTLKGTFDPASEKGDCVATETENAETLTIDLAQAGVTVENEKSIPSLILFPQHTGEKQIMLHIYTNDSQHYGCRLQFGGGNLAASNDYQYTITVNRTGLDVEKATIVDWGEKKLDGEATLQ